MVHHYYPTSLFTCSCNLPIKSYKAYLNVFQSYEPVLYRRTLEIRFSFGWRGGGDRVSELLFFLSKIISSFLLED